MKDNISYERRVIRLLSKSNKKEKLRKLEEKNSRFSIRKLSVGAASVLIGLTFMGVSNNKADAATTDPAQVATVTTVQKDGAKPQEDKTPSNDGNQTVQSAQQKANTSSADSTRQTSQDVDKTQVPNTPSNQAVENAPAVKGDGAESNGDKIGNIQSTVSVTATNKNTNQTSSSSASIVKVNEPVAEDLSGVITLTNDTDQEQQLNGPIYMVPAWFGTNTPIVVDSSKVKVDNGQVVFGGNYTDSNVSIIAWDVADKPEGSTDVSGSQENKDAVAKDPTVIGGFQLGGSLKAHETVNIIVPFKVTDTQHFVQGKFGNYSGQQINITADPENFRYDANDYTDSSLSVDGLTDVYISNLDDNNGDLNVVGQITNNGFISHDENLVFNLSDADNTDIHKAQTVLDHSKAIELDWDNASDSDITYYVDGTYKTTDQMTESDWDHVTKVKVNASLQSGQTGKVTIPVKLSNVDQIRSDLQGGADLTSSQNRKNTITLSVNSDNAEIDVTNGTVNYFYEMPTMSAIEDIIDGKSSIVPVTVITDQNGKSTLVPVKGITLPQLDKDDFIFINIVHDPSDPTDRSDIPFTDGIYGIKLDKIFNAVKDQGYSVKISKADNGEEATLPAYYAEVKLGTKNNNPLYVQLQQIFDTKDLNLMSGDSWNSNDSLVSANVDYVDAGSKDLKATGDYTYDLYDQNGNQIDKDVPVGQNVPTLAMGTYKVVYHYQINNDETVSKTATIVVNASTSGDPLVQPELPEAPLPQEPENSTTPTNPTTSSDNNNTSSQLSDDNDENSVKPHAGAKPNNGNHKGYTSKSNGKTSGVHSASAANSSSNNGVANSTLQAATIDHNGQGNGNSAQSQNGEKALPQTGEENTNAGLFGLMIASLGALLGLAGYRKRKN